MRGKRSRSTTKKANLLYFRQESKKLPPILPKPIHIVGKGTLSPILSCTPYKPITPFLRKKIPSHPFFRRLSIWTLPLVEVVNLNFLFRIVEMNCTSLKWLKHYINLYYNTRLTNKMLKHCKKLHYLILFVISLFL